MHCDIVNPQEGTRRIVFKSYICMGFLIRLWLCKFIINDDELSKKLFHQNICVYFDFTVLVVDISSPAFLNDHIYDHDVGDIM